MCVCSLNTFLSFTPYYCFPFNLMLLYPKLSYLTTKRQSSLLQHYSFTPNGCFPLSYVRHSLYFHLLQSPYWLLSFLHIALFQLHMQLHIHQLLGFHIFTHSHLSYNHNTPLLSLFFLKHFSY
jgi:hypothetical protein